MKSGIDASKLNHDSQSVKDYLLDPMVHKVVTPRWFTETEKAQKEVEKKIKKLKIPLFFMQGGEDILASPKGGKKIFDKIEFGDKIYKLYPELYHEVLHEPQKLEIYSEINDWIIKLKR
jgi:alpha-beta hydrolase superfamily lysophospholipase